MLVICHLNIYLTEGVTIMIQGMFTLCGAPTQRAPYVGTKFSLEQRNVNYILTLFQRHMPAG